MTRDDFLALRDKILQGDPPFTVDSLGKPARKTGIPGLIERRALGDYDVSASGVRLALEGVLVLVQDRIDRMKKS
jgi:hypothetical protein